MPCRQKKAAPKADPVDVRMSDPDQKRPPFGHKTTPLGYLRPDFPLPRPGGMIYLPRNATGDTRKQAFGFGGTRTPFRVVECSWVYAREKGEKLDPLDPRPALHVKTTMHVRRLTPKEAYVDRGWEREPGVGPAVFSARDTDRVLEIVVVCMEHSALHEVLIYAEGA